MLLDRKRFGLILRVFAKTQDQVEKNATQVLHAAKIAADLKIGGKQVFSNILILVAADPAYPDCDCGKTLPYLRSQISADETIVADAVEKGDLFCGLLNFGVATLLRKRTDYVGILSHGAAAYLTEAFMRQVIEAFENGALVAGAVIEELSQSILEGRIANTCAFWDALALVSVGGFDLRAAQPRKNDLTAPYMRGWNAEQENMTGNGEVFYPLMGVEEIIPLGRFARIYGQCIAPIVPAGVAEWKAPDPATDPEGYKRHVKKMGTKLERQSAHAAFEQTDLSVLKGAVLPPYRR